MESELYPIRVLAQLTKLADVVVKDRTSILKLKKKKVLTQLSERVDFDVIKFLEEMSSKKLPQNVQIELDEWVGASEAFTLYENVTLLEGDCDLHEIDRFTIESVTPAIKIVHSPDRLFAYLEKKELVPLHVKHRSSSLTPLPEGANTVFQRQDSSSKTKARAKEKKPVTIKREVQITFHFLEKEILRLNKFGKIFITPNMITILKLEDFQNIWFC